jgi:hypothetical protein
MDLRETDSGLYPMGGSHNSIALRITQTSSSPEDGNQSEGKFVSVLN